jgi:hypothetical protein
MANIMSADDILAGSGGSYLSADDKAELHAEQRAFWITAAVAEQEGQFGVQTVFTIREKGGDEQKIAFSASATRIEQAKRISQAIANGCDAAGPFYLGRWEANGRSGWQFTSEPTKPLAIPPASPSLTSTPAAAAQPSQVVDVDADLPF